MQANTQHTSQSDVHERGPGGRQQRKATLAHNLALIALHEATRPQTPIRRTAPIPRGFYQSEAWKRLRYITLRRYGARCHACGATPADGATMQVDHIRPLSLYPGLALDPNNLQVLCAACNNGKNNTDTTDWRPPVDHPPA